MKKHIVGPVEDAALILHQAGWPDWRIGEALGCKKITIFHWRKRNAIPANCPPSKIDSSRFLEMYNAEMTDTQIAQEFGLTQSRINKWRKARGIEAVTRPTSPLSDEERRRCKDLLRQGLSARQVSEETGRSIDTVKIIRQGMKNKSGLRQSGRSVHHDQLRAKSHDPNLILERIYAAIPNGISRDIADDVASRMSVGVFSGHVTVDDIEKSVRRFLNMTFASDAPKFGAISLDDGAFGRALLETVEDDGAEATIEGAGAAAFERSR